MTPAEVRELHERWGYAGPAPRSDWIWCCRCGEPWPPKPGFWGHRSGPWQTCRACQRDRETGAGWPRPDAWHRKNRWGRDGTLLRRCSRCGAWKPLRDYHATRKRGEAIQAHTWCRRCMNHPPARYLRQRKTRSAA